MAARILRESVAYAAQRKQFGQRIGDFQLVQAMLADSQAEIAGRLVAGAVGTRAATTPSLSA